MGFIKEFKNFAMRGNLVDIAVAFVMGGAFGKVISSLTEGMIAPLVGMLTGKDLNKHAWVIKEAVPEVKETIAAGRDSMGVVKDAVVKVIREAEPEVSIKWGAFITATIDFIIVAFVMFLVIKALNSMKKKQEEASAAPSTTDQLLMEIRDSLKK